MIYNGYLFEVSKTSMVTKSQLSVNGSLWTQNFCIIKEKTFNKFVIQLVNGNREYTFIRQLNKDICKWKDKNIIPQLILVY